MIEINEDYALTADEYQWVLIGPRLKKDGTPQKQPRQRYYPHLPALLKELAHIEAYSLTRDLSAIGEVVVNLGEWAKSVQNTLERSSGVSDAA